MSGNLLHPPEWFSESQRACWTRALAAAPSGMLKLADSNALSAFVVAEDLFRRANEKLNPDVMLIRTPNGSAQQSPYLAVINRQSVLMLRAAAELGYTPSSRSRVQVDPDDKDPDEFFG